MTRIEKAKAAGGKPAAGLGAESANVQCEHFTTERRSSQAAAILGEMHLKAARLELSDLARDLEALASRWEAQGWTP